MANGTVTAPVTAPVDDASGEGDRPVRPVSSGASPSFDARETRTRDSTRAMPAAITTPARPTVMPSPYPSARPRISPGRPYQPHEHHPHDVRAWVAPLLREATFPMRRWQILTCADLYGAGAWTRGLLAHLPDLTYRSLDDVATLLCRPGGNHPHGPQEWFRRAAREQTATAEVECCPDPDMAATAGSERVPA